MPRGSKIGERRGGRQRGTPNRRTVFVERILAIASERQMKSAYDFIDILVKDKELPADLRMAIARKFLLGVPWRSVGTRARSLLQTNDERLTQQARCPSRRALRSR